MKYTQKQIFETLPVSRAVLTMAIPSIVSQIIVLIYNVADTFYLGLTNNPYMIAGVSLILPVFNLSLTISGLCGVGAGTQLSRLLGRKEREQARKVCSYGIYLAAIITLIFSLVLFLFSQSFLLLLGASEHTQLFAWQYMLCVTIIGGLPTVLSNTLSALLRSAGYSSQAGFGIAMGGILNMILDPLFMFMLFPKGSEVLGVGVATLLSNTAATLYFLWSMHRIKDPVLGISFAGFPDGDNIRAVFSVGIPSSIATFLFDLDYIVIDRLMAGYGDLQLAAIGITLKVERFPLNVGVGLCQGMSPIVAYNFASKDTERMNRTIAYSLRLGLIIASISLVMYELFAPQFAGLFIGEGETLGYATYFLRIRSIATTFMFMCFFFVYIFQAFEKGMIALFLGVMRWAGLNIPMLFIMNALMGYMGIVWAQSIADVIMVAISFACYNRYLKQRDARGFYPYFLHPLKAQA